MYCPPEANMNSFQESVLLSNSEAARIYGVKKPAGHPDNNDPFNFQNLENDGDKLEQFAAYCGKTTDEVKAKLREFNKAKENPAPEPPAAE